MRVFGENPSTVEGFFAKNGHFKNSHFGTFLAQNGSFWEDQKWTKNDPFLGTCPTKTTRSGMAWLGGHRPWGSTARPLRESSRTPAEVD